MLAGSCLEASLCTHMEWVMWGLEAKLTSGVVALVDSGAMHSFVAQELVQKYQLPVTVDDGMQVTLADGSLVTSSTFCKVPLVSCMDKGKAVAFGM